MLIPPPETNELSDRLISKYTSLYDNRDICGGNCNHPTGKCSGNCQICFDQIHYHQPGRITYDCQKLIYKYVSNYLTKYCSEITSAIQHIDFMNYSCLNILSIGCGAAPDLIAFDKQVINKPINYTGIDPNVLWGDVQQDIKNFFSVQGNHYIQFLPLCISQWFNVVVIEYLLSAFVDSERANYARQLFDGIISYVLMQRSDNEPFLIVLSDVDSINDGRPYFHWLLNKLEDAGYSGRVLARSAYPEGDLGANRWGMQNTQRKETFAYSYEQVMQHQPAQLIIEVS